MSRRSKKKRQAQVLLRQKAARPPIPPLAGENKDEGRHFLNKADAEVKPAVIDYGSRVFSHDESLLERARTQWQFGDWESLANLSSDSLQSHPDRAKLALLAAAGHLQRNNAGVARQFIRLAQSWGCSKKLVSQILIAGVHNSLGRAAAASGQDQRAVKHFEGAIRIVAPNTEVELWGHARAVREMTDIGLLPQATTKLGQLHSKIKQSGSFLADAEAHAKVLDMEVEWLHGRVSSLQKQFDQTRAVSPVVGHFTDPNLNTTPLEKSGEHKAAPKIYYGLNGVDRKLEAYIDYDNGYFVELGANDGIRQSNTAYFEKECGWRGLLIEPILHNFLKCKANRSHENAYACSACVSFSYTKPHVNLIYSDLMTTPTGVESDILDPQAHAQSGKAYLTEGDAPVEILAPAKTLNALLDEAQAPHHIDLLSLDVEGAEIEVLKGIDHEQYRFKYLLIECRDEHVLHDYLGRFGYRLIDKLSNHDYLFRDSSKNGMGES